MLFVEGPPRWHMSRGAEGVAVIAVFEAVVTLTPYLHNGDKKSHAGA